MSDIRVAPVWPVISQKLARWTAQPQWRANATQAEGRELSPPESIGIPIAVEHPALPLDLERRSMALERPTNGTPPTGKTEQASTRRVLNTTLWLVAVLGLMAASFILGRVTIGSKMLPEIAATLPGEESQFPGELDRRFRDRFPIGSDEDKLLYFLRTQNFIPDWRRRDEPNAAYFLRRGLLCEQTIFVTWSAEPSGALRSVRADYKSHCL